MSSKSTVTIDAGAKFRLQAGPYDLHTNTPKYGFEVSAADEASRYRVIDNSQIMGVPGRHFWVWDITNESSMPVFVTLTKDGVPFDARA
ncbi:hypothetical protein [Pseudomonas sp. R76]|uniref:hypothetical protein n=1 Tax=Pseudomonas sp. R76 TaxID=1573711 RepID=UPI00131FC7B7|nr:hypothetical protein [Pseudomonas sp. R76]QHD04231.1 hypothetical protein PspR76_00090 [Pseudomonas sp. R76]